jgi:hypothetical protein
MNIRDFILLVLAFGFAALTVILIRKIREFRSPPKEQSNELGERVQRLLEKAQEEKKKDTEELPPLDSL